jgi:hypothetical protein
MAEGAGIQNEGIAGFKKGDFVEPDQVMGPDCRIESLPDGIRFFIRGQAINVGQQRIVCNLYELVREGDGLKLRREHLEKFLNRLPDEEEIALRYGPSEEGYIWIAKWSDLAGKEKGIMSDTIRVSEKWRARYEAAQRKAAGEPSPGETRAAPVPVPAASQGIGPMDLLKLMEAGEDRAFRNMERMAMIMKGGASQAPESVMAKAYEAAGAIMEKALNSNLEMGRKVGKVIQRGMEPERDDGEGEDQGDQGAAGTGVMDHIPAFLRPFIPQLEQWLGTLIGGGPMAAAAKTLIINSEQWKSIFTDPEKWGQTVAAMEQHFGSEQTQKAIDVLLNRRGEKGKGKGK